MWFIRKCSNLTEGYLKNQKCPPYFVNLNMVNFQTLILNRSDINTRLTIFSFFIQTVKNVGRDPPENSGRDLDRVEVPNTTLNF